MLYVASALDLRPYVEVGLGKGASNVLIKLNRLLLLRSDNGEEP